MTAQPVHLYVTDTMADWEPAYATAHIRKPSWQRTPGRYTVRTVGATLEPITTMGGLELTPEETFDQVTPEHSAMLVLAGADTWGDADRHAAVIAKAHEFLDAGTPVAAICGATLGLAVAGILDDREHTSNAPVFLAMSGYAGGDLYRHEPAVTDRGLITASGTQPVDFATHIFAALDLYEPHILAAWHGLYTTGEERHFAVLAAA